MSKKTNANISILNNEGVTVRSIELRIENVDDKIFTADLVSVVKSALHKNGFAACEACEIYVPHKILNDDMGSLWCPECLERYENENEETTERECLTCHEKHPENSMKGVVGGKKVELVCETCRNSLNEILS